MGAMKRQAPFTARNPSDSRDIGDFDRAAAVRRQAAWSLPMSERLAQVHSLSKQVNTIKSAARSR
jgi:hypothetical protein